MVDDPRMVHLATTRAGFEAQLLVARLGSEGVLWQLRGADPVYPVGEVSVLVAERDLDLARELLLVDEVEAAFDEEDFPVSAPSRAWPMVAGLALVVTFTVGRLLLLLGA